MKLVILNNKKLDFFYLPFKIEGSFLLNCFNNEESLISIEAVNGNWMMYSNDEVKIIENNQVLEKTIIKENKFYLLQYEKTNILIYAMKNYDETFIKYSFSNNINLLIGKNENCNIIFNQNNILDKHLMLTYNQGIWNLQIATNALIYVNNVRVLETNVNLKNGDMLFVCGLKIVLANNLILINNPENLFIKTNLLKAVSINLPDVPYEEVNEKNYYTDDDYFFKKPRLRQFVETYETMIAVPPEKQNLNAMPLFLTIGPMLTMGVMSIASLTDVMIRLLNKKTTLADSWISILMAAIMLLSMLLWPILTRRWQEKQNKKFEEKRKQRFSKYIEEKRQKIQEKINEQSRILLENFLPVIECYKTIIEKRRNLWERKITHKDFLEVRLGTGDIPLDANINYNEEEFSMEDDEIRDLASNLYNETKMLRNVPVTYTFFNRKATAIMGVEKKLNKFISNIILQFIAYHSYDDLKIVVFTDDRNSYLWDFCKMLPHCFSNNKKVRFFATNEEERKFLSEYLEQEFIKRATDEENKQVVETEGENISYLPYYIIITDDFNSIRKLGITEYILKTKQNFGFSFIIKENKLGKLPSECVDFISVNNRSVSILRNDFEDNYEINCKNDLEIDLDIRECCKVLSNIPIEFYENTRNIPDSLGFLEMYNIGKIEQLNAFNRWNLNDPTKSLRAIIGINNSGDRIYLDLHEKYHGPHGLIAGTTGSGKSEFIITYILSMCVNYSPNEVAFILIDYKGGGLAGAFKNKLKNLYLPHLAGVITNLDKSELNRTLVSIESELKRRQTKFNEARDKLGESTMDIYKYQKFFREGKLKEPLPHLFIISDEFAELKDQQPDFMDNLISAARIGRSLGVHLILATQKPSGVVNEQIWSNSKFKVCLKVQDDSDSNEILKKPDAARITQPGRFYLQVGNDEIFVLGQSGWCGTNYIPSNKVNKKVDRTVEIIDNVGRIVKDSVDNKENVITENLGDELTNILEYVVNLANQENLTVRKLWLDNIPEKIYVDDIIRKYHIEPVYNKIKVILGEYDDPSNQRQDVLSLDLVGEGNTLLYGASGVGKEMFINSLVYSASILYGPEYVNFYILDFGSESLRIFSKFPQVGDVVFQTDKEKIEKLIIQISNEIKYRKKLFADYNGDYENYCKNSGNQLPLKIIVLNNYESFIETYYQYEENLVTLSRDGKRYGIIFVVTATGMNGMVSTFIKNFDNTYTIDLASKDDYEYILGRIGNVYPRDFEGRGLFKKENAYEFQTAYICEKENFVEFIKQKASELRSKYSSSAPKIPVLPDIITLDMLKSTLKNLKTIPIGIEKETLKPCTYNFEDQKVTLITGSKNELFVNILKNLLIEFKMLKNVATIIIDPEQLIVNFKNYSNSYCDNQFNLFIDQLNKYIDEKIANSNVQLYILIIGINKLISKLDAQKMDELAERIKNNENVREIIIETANKLKNYTYEIWYSSLVDDTTGIYIGDKILDQSVIRGNFMDKMYNEKLTKDYAWVIEDGDGKLVKLINSDGEENE